MLAAAISKTITPPERFSLSAVLRSTSRWQRVLLALGLTIPLLLLLWFCWHQRVKVLQEANGTATRSVVALEQHAANMLDVHMLILRQLDELTQGKSGSQINADAQLGQSVARLTREFPQVSVVGMADADGRIRLSSVEGATRGASVGDRDYFLAHKNAAAKGIYVGEAFTGRLNGVRQFSISLSRFTDSGSFNGIIFATVPLQHFTQFWEQFTPSAGYLIPLVRNDGALIVRYPSLDSPARLSPQGPFMTQLRQSRRGLYKAVSQIDGVERINAYSQVRNYPLYISYSVETAVVLSQWWRESLLAAGMAVFSSLILAALWLAVVRQMHEQRVSVTRWRVIAEDLRLEVGRREIAEEALRQSQKMEAVGQLAGGIAHDFNNLLAGLVGNLQLMRRRLDQGLAKDLPRYVAAAESITIKAAAMTQRLLAFSRRQTLAPAPLDVKKQVEAMHELITRTVGPSIRVRTMFAPEPCKTLCDPNQFDSALLNLAVNARDAMPDGGDLTITAARAQLTAEQAGALQLAADLAYVVVSVNDNGAGMTPKIIERAFEPFFTTKPTGQGTGLGLSMVYGFVTQSGGQVKINSQLGVGTEVSIYLPAHEGEMPPSTPALKAADTCQSKADTCILLVDDEIMVRETLAEVLIEQGYRVMQAANGAQGLEVLQSTQRIDLLISDVGLPGHMNGRQLADAGRKLRPELKILFITGYADRAASAGGLAGQDMEVMIKPFGLDEFERKVSDMTSALDRTCSSV
ncbi:MAG: Blue-light-activated protein [Polaromonas sp.]|nr:Blue-light-activated protein [Polaromonas sp.]